MKKAKLAIGNGKIKVVVDNKYLIINFIDAELDESLYKEFLSDMGAYNTLLYNGSILKDDFYKFDFIAPALNIEHYGAEYISKSYAKKSYIGDTEYSYESDREYDAYYKANTYNMDLDRHIYNKYRYVTEVISSKDPLRRTVDGGDIIYRFNDKKEAETAYYHLLSYLYNYIKAYDNMHLVGLRYINDMCEPNDMISYYSNKLDYITRENRFRFRTGSIYPMRLARKPSPAQEIFYAI